MKKLKITDGLATSNSVKYFVDGKEKGVEAIRQEDGTIVTKECSRTFDAKQILVVLGGITILALFKKCVLWFNLPLILYHIPLVIWLAISIKSIASLYKKKEQRLYHGAEHKVYKWYKNDTSENIQNIKNYTRINRYCGSSIAGTMLTFQIISSVCLIFFNIRIPELLTNILPLFLYKVIPFNALGLFIQLFTTANPTDQHIEVALEALKKAAQD